LKSADKPRLAWQTLCGFMLLLGTFVVPAVAQTATEQLKEAIQLFDQGQYDKAQELLLAIDQDKLNDGDKKQRDDYVDKVTSAINLSKKAQQDLDDGNQAFDANRLDEAAKKYQSVLKNNYASKKQKEEAERRQALIQEKQKIAPKAETSDQAENKPAAPTTQTEAAEKGTKAPAVPTTKAAVKKAPVKPTTKPAVAAKDKKSSGTDELVNKGEEAVRAGDFDAADKLFAEALRISPNNADAVAGKKLVAEYRSAEGKPSNLLNRYQALRDLRWQRVERIFREREREVRELMLEHRYDDAAQTLQTAKQTVEAGKKDAEPVELYTALQHEVQQLEDWLSKERVRFQEEQGAEAVRKLEVENFPVTVINDIYGKDLYEEGKAKYRK